MGIGGKEFVERLAHFRPLALADDGLGKIIVAHQHAAILQLRPPGLQVGHHRVIVVPGIDVQHIGTDGLFLQQLERIDGVQRQRHHEILQTFIDDVGGELVIEARIAELEIQVGDELLPQVMLGRAQPGVDGDHHRVQLQALDFFGQGHDRGAFPHTDFHHDAGFGFIDGARQIGVLGMPALQVGGPSGGKILQRIAAEKQLVQEALACAHDFASARACSKAISRGVVQRL